jgi:hypothetical protein
MPAGRMAWTIASLLPMLSPLRPRQLAWPRTVGQPRPPCPRRQPLDRSSPLALLAAPPAAIACRSSDRSTRRARVRSNPSTVNARTVTGAPALWIDTTNRSLRSRTSAASRLPTDKLFKIGDGLGLHPSMRAASDLREGGRPAIVQGVGYQNFPSRRIGAPGSRLAPTPCEQRTGNPAECGTPCRATWCRPAGRWECGVGRCNLRCETERSLRSRLSTSDDSKRVARFGAPLDFNGHERAVYSPRIDPRGLE